MQISGVPFLRSRHLPRLILWCGGFMVFAIVALIGGAIAWLHHQTLRDTESRLNQLNLVLAEQLARSFGSLDSVMQAMVSLAKRDDFEQPATRLRLHNYLARQAETLPQARSFLVLDRNGDLVIDSRHSKPRTYNGADRENFSILKNGRGNQLQIDATIQGRMTGEPLFSVSRRLETASGEFAGVMLSAVDMDYYVNFFKSVQLGDDGIISLSRRDGTYEAGYPLNEGLLGKVLDGGRIHREFLAENNAGVTIETSPFSGARRMMAFRTVEGYPLFVVVSRSISDILAPWRRQAIALGVFGAAAIGVLCLIGYVLLMMARAQENLLQDAVEARAQAEGAKREAEQANKARSKFFAGLSHDLRSPLSAITGFADLMLNGHAGQMNDKGRDYAANIRASSGHLLGLINDLMDLAKAEGGHLKLFEDEIALRTLIGDCLRLCDAQAVAAQIALTPYEDAGIGLRGDVMRLRQILINLLSNAIKFTPAGGRVTVTTDVAADGSLRITVADNGIGMDVGDIGTALEPYGQVINDFTRNRSGTGLGLPVVNTLTELHGGRLEVESELGQGSRFIVVMPPARVLRLKSVRAA